MLEEIYKEQRLTTCRGDGFLWEVTAQPPPEGSGGIWQVDKERRVLAGLDELSGDPFHGELYCLLFLTQALPSVLRRDEQAHSSAILEVL